MSEGQKKKRKSKGWYRKQAFHNKRMKTDDRQGHRLVPGLKGFIVTCNDHEREAVKETYNILNEYADKLYGPEAKEEAESSGESDGDDIEKAIAKEVQSLKEAATSGARRFQNSQSGAKNCIFIKTTVEDPSALAYAIFSDLLQTKVQKSRYALRLLPVVGTCKANLKEIAELAKTVLKPFLSETKYEVTYVILFKARNNNGLGREMTISTLRNTITETFSSSLLRYTLANPQVTVLVEIMCGVACIAVAKDFALFRKYNLVEIVSEKQAPVVAAKGESTAKPEDEKAMQVEACEKDTVCQQQQEVTNVSEKPKNVADTNSQSSNSEMDFNVAFKPESSSITNTDASPEVDLDAVRKDNPCTISAVAVNDQDGAGKSIAEVKEQKTDSSLQDHGVSDSSTVLLDQAIPAESKEPSTEMQ